MQYSFGEFELDTQHYELRQAGSVRPLEPQGFKVLAEVRVCNSILPQE